MASAHFAIAKYVPNALRMEPRNFGVIVWADGAVRAKFLGERQAGQAPAKPPKRVGVRSVNAYRQWVTHWRYLIDAEAIRARDGRDVSRSSPEFLEALCEHSRTQFFLTRGGRVLADVTAAEIGDVVEELFGELVEHEGTETPAAEQESVLLKKACNDIFAATGLTDREDFWPGFDWLCHVAGQPTNFHFNYALHDRVPRAVFHRIPLRRREKVHNAAFMFDWMARSNTVDRDNCGALVYAPEDALEDGDVASSLAVMQAFGTVVNTAHREMATEQILRIAN